MSRFNINNKTQVKEPANQDKGVKAGIIAFEMLDPIPMAMPVGKIAIETKESEPPVLQNQEEFYEMISKNSQFNIVSHIPKMTQQEANAKLAQLVADIYSKIREAQELADEHELGFSLDVEYGMGGSYEEGAWHPSSQSC